MALPRLTGALRSFSNVTKQDNYNEEVADLKVNVLDKNCYKHRVWELFDIPLFSVMSLNWEFYLVWCETKKENGIKIFLWEYLHTYDYNIKWKNKNYEFC